MTMVSVDLVTDPVCPWCWLGLRYWRQARLMVPDVQTETILRPFQLDSGVPKGGVSYGEYMAKKFGSGPSDRFRAMREHLEAAAPDAGIVFRFDDIPVRPNTLDAHRMIRWAQGQDLGETAMDLVHKAFFEERRDIGDPAVLAQIAAEAGLDGALVNELLATDRDAEDVRREEAFYRSLGVQGVPCFIFNGEFAVSGAEEPMVLAEAIKRAAGLLPAGNA